MSIDPAAKLAKLHAQQQIRSRVNAAKAAARKRREPKRRRGPVSRREQHAVNALVSQLPQTLAPNSQQINSIAQTIGRTPATVQSMIEIARDRFQSRAVEYVDKHMQAIDKALELGEVGEARKGAEFAIEKLSGKSSSGKSVRIIEKAENESSAPVIRIGIALGGLGIDKSMNNNALAPLGTVEGEIVKQPDDTENK